MFIFNLFLYKYNNGSSNMMEEVFREYRKIGKYKVSLACLQRHPCVHDVKFENGDQHMMRGDQIYSMLHSEGISDKYFDKYAEFVRKRDFPTPKEIREREEQELESKMKQEKYMKEQNEKQKIIDKYKASSRLDKLKSKNNII